MSSSRCLTRKERDRLAALSDLFIVSQEYKNKMVGKIFMYVFDNRYIEVYFKADNFKHLTDVASSLTPNQFYQNSVDRTLTTGQIDFNSRHPYRLAKNKLRHLSNFFDSLTSECFMQEDITTDSGSYKFGTTEMNFSLLLIEDINLTTKVKRSDYYIAKSLRDKDCFDKSRAVHSVTHIFVRNNDEKKYSNALYIDSNFKSQVPQEVKEKLADNVLPLVD